MEFWTSDKKKPYDSAMNEILNYIEKIDNEKYRKSGTHIVRHIEKRLKTEESIEEKLKRKGKSSDINIEKVINDLAGVRIICLDTKQVYMIVREIKKNKNIIVLKEKDYITHPKENGYQSYHIIVKVKNIKLELQIRTILMDAWASLETVLIYKKVDKPPKEIIDRIQKFSKWSKKMDSMFNGMIESKG